MNISKELVKENSNYINEIQSLDRDKQELRLLEDRVRQSSKTIEELNLKLRVFLD